MEVQAHQNDKNPPPPPGYIRKSPGKDRHLRLQCGSVNTLAALPLSTARPLNPTLQCPLRSVHL